MTKSHSARWTPAAARGREKVVLGCPVLKEAPALKFRGDLCDWESQGPRFVSAPEAENETAEDRTPKVRIFFERRYSLQIVQAASPAGCRCTLDTVYSPYVGLG